MGIATPIKPWYWRYSLETSIRTIQNPCWGHRWDPRSTESATLRMSQLARWIPSPETSPESSWFLLPNGSTVEQSATTELKVSSKNKIISLQCQKGFAYDCFLCRAWAVHQTAPIDARWSPHGLGENTWKILIHITCPSSPAKQSSLFLVGISARRSNKICQWISMARVRHLAGPMLCTTAIFDASKSFALRLVRRQ